MPAIQPIGNVTNSCSSFVQKFWNNFRVKILENSLKSRKLGHCTGLVFLFRAFLPEAGIGYAPSVL